MNKFFLRHRERERKIKKISFIIKKKCFDDFVCKFLYLRAEEEEEKKGKINFLSLSLAGY
jgi:hypothetical protein